MDNQETGPCSSLISDGTNGRLSKRHLQTLLAVINFVVYYAVVLAMPVLVVLVLSLQTFDHRHLLLMGADGHLPGGSGLRDMLDRAQDAWTAEGGEDLLL